jgi:ABC-type nitrate/sulfonate/bicarbonate transport system substrate-binding protein
MILRRALLQSAGAVCIGSPLLASASTPERLRVKVFPGAQNLALFAAQEQGLFKAQGVDVDLQFTQNSTELRTGLAAGAFDIAHAAVDNAVAMRESAGADIAIVMGGDSSMNEFFVQPEITEVAQMRGRTLIVDAPNTAYALQARKVLLNAGLKAGDYTVKIVGGTFQRVGAMRDDRSHSASALNPPFSFQAREFGLRSLGRMIDLIGPYQGSGVFVMRAWGHANPAALERYLAALVQALRWARSPQHREAVLAMLGKRLNLPAPITALTYEALMEPRFGLVPDSRFDAAGFQAVLALRAELEGQWGGTPPGADRYVELRWYDAALSRAG